MLTGGFESMEKFANEVHTQGKRMPATILATTTPLNDEYFARSLTYTGTRIQALDTPDHMITKEHLDLIVSWPKMIEATEEYRLDGLVS